MDMQRMMNRGLGVLLVAALATALLAPEADARRIVQRRGLRHGTVLSEGNSAAGAIFGFLGGVVLGTMIANASQAPPPRYADGCYGDPYGRDDHGRYRHYDERGTCPRRARAVHRDDRYDRRSDDGRSRYDERGRAVDDDQRDYAEPEYEEWED